MTSVLYWSSNTPCVLSSKYTSFAPRFGLAMQAKDAYTTVLHRRRRAILKGRIYWRRICSPTITPVAVTMVVITARHRRRIAGLRQSRIYDIRSDENCTHCRLITPTIHQRLIGCVAGFSCWRVRNTTTVSGCEIRPVGLEKALGVDIATALDPCRVRPVRSKIYFCLSNAMHGQNINLPACLYVSITLSVNSHTGQTPQRIFTVDSLTDADLRKDVPFGGLDDE